MVWKFFKFRTIEDHRSLLVGYRHRRRSIVAWRATKDLLGKMDGSRYVEHRRPICVFRIAGSLAGTWDIPTLRDLQEKLQSMFYARI